MISISVDPLITGQGTRLECLSNYHSQFVVEIGMCHQETTKKKRKKKKTAKEKKIRVVEQRPCLGEIER